MCAKGAHFSGQTTAVIKKTVLKREVFFTGECGPITGRTFRNKTRCNRGGVFWLGVQLTR